MKMVKVLLVSIVGLFVCANIQALDPRYAHTPGAQYKHECFSDNVKIQEVSAQELLRKIKKNNNIVVVNVLGARFHEDAHIAGSINAPLRFLQDQAYSWDRDKEIVVYCACKECDASIKAYKLLKYMGFKRVFAYEGGMRQWFQLGYPCGGLCKEDYLREPCAQD